MTAWQKQMRDAQMDDHPVPKDFSRAEVREISYKKAEEIIVTRQYEWLGTMGTTRHCFGLFFDGELAGVECFGATAGTGVSNLCGPEHTDRVMTLVRGACVHWAHPHSASYLIPRACKLMAAEGKNIFVAYSDTKAGEIGTVYQACNWQYCGMTASGGKGLCVSPSGEEMDARNIEHHVRDCVRNTKGATFFRKPTRKEVQGKMIARGWIFKSRTPKHRYIGIYGENKLREDLIGALQWNILPYPKRPTAGN
jgi:hypothetical protein